VLDTVNWIIDDIRRRKENIRMQNDKGKPNLPSIGTVHGTAIVAESVTINTVNSPVSVAETEPISPEQVLHLDNLVSTITSSNTKLTKDDVWNDVFIALGTKSFVPASRFEEAKTLLEKRAAEIVSLAVSEQANIKAQ